MKTLVSLLFLFILLAMTPISSNGQVPNVAGLVGISASRNAGYTSPNLTIQGQVRAKTKRVAIQEELTFSNAKKEYVGNGSTFSSRTDLEFQVTNYFSAGPTLEVKNTTNSQFKKTAGAVGGLAKFNYQDNFFPYLRVMLPDSTQNKAYTFGGGFEYYYQLKAKSYGIECKTEFTVQKYKQFPFPDRQTASGISVMVGIYKNLSR